MQKIHELKTIPPYWEYVDSGRKPFDVRPADRPFNVGDTVRLREWTASGGYTGRTCERIITFKLSGPEQFGVESGFTVLGFGPAYPAEVIARAHHDAYCMTGEQCTGETDEHDDDYAEKHVDLVQPRITEVLLP